ncbi:hypothetical protein [Salinarimonas ramus]|uniref:Uncharacterized protein n=1 Tax=Salinarimonas ramus TaxID=690164 RepID=A0A917V4X2_9HYPH|nr:hypothetical protein [Salinarimonas ramus]GGK37207.1 hypothetical protein GCM10011322_25290 [Salinarimonas ramus]
MTNKDMVKSVDPEKAKSPGADLAREEHARTTPRDGIRDEQFPDESDPQDSNQLKPMINARAKAGLKRG